MNVLATAFGPTRAQGPPNTRDGRLDRAVAHSARGRRIGQRHHKLRMMGIDGAKK